MASTNRKKPPTRTPKQPIQFPQPESEAQTSTAVEESPAPQIPADEPPEKTETKVEPTEVKRSGPKNKEGLNFFQRLHTHPANEWRDGQLVIYSYRYQPYTDRTMGGNRAVFLLKYTSPIDEETILMDHGSGVYHFKLNRSEGAETRSRPIDAADLSIVNQKFPPKIPPGEWVDDPRNRAWAWAAPKGSVYHQPGAADVPPAPAAPSAMETFKTFVEIQDQIEARMPKPEVVDPIAQANATISLMEKAAALSRPAESGGMNEFMMKRFDAMEKEVAAARDRGDRLMEKLIESNNKKPEGGNGLGTLKEIISTVKEFLPTVKEFMPQGAGGDALPRREKEPWWTGIATTAIEAVQPAMPVLVHGIMQWVQRQPAPAHPKTIDGTAAPTNTAPPAVAEPDIWDLLVKALEGDATGEDFAESVVTLYGKWKYKQACMLGEQGLLTLLQNHPIWQKLGEGGQNAMPKFIHEFVSYGKDPDDEGEGELEPDGDEPEPETPGAKAEAQPIEL